MSKRSFVLPVSLLLALWAGFGRAEPSTLEAIQPWMRAMPPTSRTAAVYLQLVNHGNAPRRVVGACSEIAARVEVHQHLHADGMMQMRKVDALDVPAEGEVTFAPGGLHLMLFELERVPAAGESFVVRLEFDDGQTLDLDVQVVSDSE